MQNQYLEILELSPGASKAQVKSAYRRLSKIYHPDVSKDENAREKFIEINEAYKFLTDVGPRPTTIQSSAPAYDYDVQDHAYDEWKRKARAFAQKRAKEAALRQLELIQYMIKGANVIAIFVVVFNVLLIADVNLAPSVYHEIEFDERPIRFKRERYTDVIFSDHVFRLQSGGINVSSNYQGSNIYATPILDIPLKLEVISSTIEEYRPEYGVLIRFGFMIPLLLVLVVLYFLVSRPIDTKLTFGIFFFLIQCFQLYLYLKF